MKTFENSIVTYADFLAVVREHTKADNYIQGTYWNAETYQGCNIGCTLYTFFRKPAIEAILKERGLGIFAGNHALYEPLFNIPIAIAKLTDKIFEGLPRAEARRFPLQFAKALGTDMDLSLVWPKLAIWLLTDDTYGAINATKHVSVQDAVLKVFDLFRRGLAGDIPAQAEWQAARQYAGDAVYAANDAAYAANAAAYAAYAAAYAAYAATAADDAAYAAYAANAAAYAGGNINSLLWYPTVLFSIVITHTMDAYIFKPSFVDNPKQARLAYYRALRNKFLELIIECRIISE